MEVISLIENTAYPDGKVLQAEHGLSLFISTQNQSLLFDTGGSDAFMRNAEKIGVDLASVNLAVISHHHRDHGGGLATFLAANQHARVYLRNSATEQFTLDLFGLIRRPVGLDASLFQIYPHRFTHINRFCEIVPDVFILTKIDHHHALPKGNRHLFMEDGTSRRPDSFDHELVLVIRQSDGLAVFTGCSHQGILNMLDAVVEQFPGQTIRAVFGGFHLIDIPLLNNMAGGKTAVEALGKTLLEYPIEKIYTGHCTGIRAYGILKSILGSKLHYFATGDRAVV